MLRALSAVLEHLVLHLPSSLPLHLHSALLFVFVAIQNHSQCKFQLFSIGLHGRLTSQLLSNPSPLPSAWQLNGRSDCCNCQRLNGLAKLYKHPSRTRTGSLIITIALRIDFWSCQRVARRDDRVNQLGSHDRVLSLN